MIFQRDFDRFVLLSQVIRNQYGTCAPLSARKCLFVRFITHRTYTLTHYPCVACIVFFGFNNNAHCCKHRVRLVSPQKKALLCYGVAIKTAIVCANALHGEKIKIHVLYNCAFVSQHKTAIARGDKPYKTGILPHSPYTKKFNQCKGICAPAGAHNCTKPIFLACCTITKKFVR